MKLVLESGKAFDFPEILGIVPKERKRDAKQKAKESNNDIQDGINITNQFKRGRDKKSNWLEHLNERFDAQDKGGFKYECKISNCGATIVRKGKEYFLTGEHRH